MLLEFITGLALFLYGMHVLGDGLEKMSGGKLEQILERLTSTTFKGILLGAGVTAIIQSSSASTVMVVGFVNSGIMTLERGISIIIGANLGTCITSWILSLSGLDGNGFLIQMFKPENFSPVLAIIGVILIMFFNQEKKKHIGTILIGFGVLMIGMENMSDSVSALKEVPSFTSLMVKFEMPLLGLLVGLILTAVIQSSSASIGILQALSKTGAVTFANAVPIIIGQNIGTCVTAMISSVGAKKNARRAALVHLLYNVISAAVFMVIFYLLHVIVKFDFMNDKAYELDIAIFHTLFNLFKMLLLAHQTKLLATMARAIIKDAPEDEEVGSKHEVPELDDRFLDKPALAMEHCKNVAYKMAADSREALVSAISLVNKFDKDVYDLVIEKEESVDNYEDKLGTYMLKLSSKELSEADSRQLSLLLHLIGDFERISDHAVNIAKSTKKMDKKEMGFSKKAESEMAVFSDLITDIMNTSIECFVNEDDDLATYVEPMEEVVDMLNKEIKKRHVKRLRKGKCSIDMGFVLSDITTDFERIADHCSNIAVGIIQTHENGYESHEYLETLDKSENTAFYEKFISYKEKYVLP